MRIRGGIGGLLGLAWAYYVGDWIRLFYVGPSFGEAPPTWVPTPSSVLIFFAVPIIITVAFLVYLWLKVERKRQIDSKGVQAKKLESKTERAAPSESYSTKKSDEKNSDDLKKKTKYCRECGAKIPRDSKFCEECGEVLTIEEPVKTQTISPNRTELASEQAAKQESKQKKSTRRVLVAATLIILMLGCIAYFYAVYILPYPSMQVTKTNLYISESQSSYLNFSTPSTIFGNITVYIGGHGLLTRQQLSVTVDGIPVGVDSIDPTADVVTLPIELTISVSGSGICSGCGSQVQLRVDGVWSPLVATLNIPVSLTAQETIQPS